MSRLTIAGIGPGSEGYLMPEVVSRMRSASAVIAAKRVLPMLCRQCGEDEEGRFIPMGKIRDTFENIDRILSEGKDVVLAVSGDPLMYSLYNTILHDEISRDWKIEVLPGIGSLQMLGAAFGQTMEDASIISVHGRAKSPGSIALAVTENPKVFFLCSKEQGPAWLAKIMLDYHLDHVTIYAGANLSYEDQVLVSGTPEEMAERDFPSLCVAMIGNPSPRKVTRPCMLADRDFERGKTPMTKEEIRALILLKMEVGADDILWDIGAGTGSVSVECARQAPFGQVHSVEKSEEAVELIRRNRDKFGTDNLVVYRGNAIDCLEGLPDPDRVFIGGSTGQMKEILDHIAARPGKIRLVVTAVTIETIAEAAELLGQYDPSYRLIQATVGRGKVIGRYHVMDTNNPVMIFTADI